MNLVVDVGNSYIKMAVFQESKLLEKWTFLKTDFNKNFAEIKQQYPEIKGALVSTVDKSGLSGLNSLQYSYSVLFLSSQLKLPFKSHYATPQTLGHDRIALVAAASKFYKNKNVLIIDAGTCLTFDFLNSENQYLGGAISPGLKMRYDALHNFTARLPLLEPEDHVQLTGNSTKTSIHSGVINGIVKEIEGVIEEYGAQYQYLTVILTGGDMQFLSKRLKSSIFATSNFLLEGLNYILEINSNQ